MKADDTTSDAGREQISALMDGQLDRTAFHALVARLGDDDDARATWQVYHLVGEVLRSPHGAWARDSQAFAARLGARLRAEGVQPGRPELPVSVVSSASITPLKIAVNDHLTLATAEKDSKFSAPANDDHFRWQWVAGFAMLSVVAALGWNLLGSVDSPAAGQLALRPDAVGAAPDMVAALRSPDRATVVTDRTGMIRDPRLDELMAAHRQTGSLSALHNQAGFLRNATYQEAGR